MVAIFKCAGGLKFTGWVANSEEEAWAYLDEKHDHIIGGEHYGCNRRAFYMEEVELVAPTKIDTLDD